MGKKDECIPWTTLGFDVLWLDRENACADIRPALIIHMKNTRLQPNSIMK